MLSPGIPPGRATSFRGVASVPRPMLALGGAANLIWLRGRESNPLSPAYEAGGLPFSVPASICVAPCRVIHGSLRSCVASRLVAPASGTVPL